MKRNKGGKNYYRKKHLIGATFAPEVYSLTSLPKNVSQKHYWEQQDIRVERLLSLWL